MTPGREERSPPRDDPRFDAAMAPGKDPVSPNHREGNRHVEVAEAEQPPPPPGAPPSSSRMAGMLFWDGTQYILWSPELLRARVFRDGRWVEAPSKDRG